MISPKMDDLSTKFFITRCRALIIDIWWKSAIITRMKSIRKRTSYQHKSLAVGRWRQLSFVEQMANIGSEVERALNWQTKGNQAYCQRAFERALELLDLTRENLVSFARLKELSRLREVIVDYFFGTNQFNSTEKLLRSYFSAFNYATRLNH